MKVNLFWFRRDLRLEDNAALFEAGKDGLPVLPIFIFDLDDLSEFSLAYVYRSISDLQNKLAQTGSTLLTFQDKPILSFEQVFATYEVAAVFCNREYEPQALKRDRSIADLCTARGIPFHTCKDRVIFEGGEITKPDGTPYTVYTPYAKRWKTRLYASPLPAFDCSSVKFMPHAEEPFRKLSSLASDIALPQLDREKVRHYEQTRDIPGLPGTTRVGAALRFGTLSIRHCVRIALEEEAETWLNELVWREFFMQILFHFPHVVHASFKPQYDRIKWRNSEEDFHLWCAGRTGYPLVDAGMRELNATGFMHNRVRMVVASFLCKHLLIDWRWGEAYFAQKLMDYELSSNNGNWQWAAGCGCDAAPYFRVFNPERQAGRFDPEGKYIRQWIPELGSEQYPVPMVEHSFARDRALQAYKKALQK